MRMINSSGESLLGRLFNIVLPMILQFQSGCGNKLWGVFFWFYCFNHGLLTHSLQLMAPINICSYAVLIIYSGSKDSSQLLNNLIKTRAVQCWYLMNFVSHSLAKQEQCVGEFQNSNTHKFTWFGNLPTPRSYWLVLITQRNNTNKGGGENSSQLNSTHSSSLCCSHFSAVLSVFFSHSLTQLFTELISIQDGSEGA